MPDAHRHDAAEAVEVAFAGFVPDILHRALDQHDRVFVVEKNPGVHELPAQRENFRGGRPGVFLGLMTRRRQRDVFHISNASRFLFLKFC